MSEPGHTEGVMEWSEQDPKTFSGMSSWGQTFQLTIGKGIEGKYIGFTLEEANAREIVHRWNNFPVYEDLLKRTLDLIGQYDGPTFDKLYRDILKCTEPN